MQTQVVIEGAAPRTVNKKDGSGQIILYEVQLQGRKYITRKPVFDTASLMIGQVVLADTRIEQNGTYTNYYLDSVLRQDGAPQIQSAPQQTQTYVQPQTTSNAFTPPELLPPERPTPRDHQIWRQVATKVAAHTSQSKAEFWENVDHLIHFYETGEKPNATVPSPAQFAQQQTSSQNQYPADEGIPF